MKAVIRMMRQLVVVISLSVAVIVSVVPTAATAAVTATFYAHGGNQIRGGWLLFPHAYVTLTGTVDATGEVVDEAAGFTAKNPGPQLLLFSGAGVVERPDERYRSEGRAYLSLELSDRVFEAVMARVDYWRSPQGSTYSLRGRNCITFIADLARTVGLVTAAENTWSPNGFLTGTAALNPAAAVIADHAGSANPGDSPTS